MVNLVNFAFFLSSPPKHRWRLALDEVVNLVNVVVPFLKIEEKKCVSKSALFSQ